MKRIYKIAAVAAIVAAAGFTAYNAQNTKLDMSSLMADNIEAISRGEYDEFIWNRYDYTLDNGYPAVNCYKGGSSDCVLR